MCQAQESFEKRYTKILKFSSNTLYSKHTAAVRATSGQVCFIKKNDLDEVKFSENIRLNKDIQAQCW